MTQIERIMHMEECLDISRMAVDALAHALDEYIGVQGKMRDLAGYYGGDEWRNDFDADMAGELPQDLRRGVLSEDAVYDLLCDDRDLKAEILEAIAGIIREGRY